MEKQILYCNIVLLHEEQSRKLKHDVDVSEKYPKIVEMLNYQHKFKGKTPRNEQIIECGNERVKILKRKSDNSNIYLYV